MTYYVGFAENRGVKGILFYFIYLWSFWWKY